MEAKKAKKKAKKAKAQVAKIKSALKAAKKDAKADSKKEKAIEAKDTAKEAIKADKANKGLRVPGCAAGADQKSARLVQEAETHALRGCRAAHLRSPHPK